MARVLDIGSRGSRGLRIYSTLRLTIGILLLSVETKSYSLVPKKSNVLRRYRSWLSDMYLKVNAVIGRKSSCRFPDQTKKKNRGIERQKPSKEGPASRNV
jgi:hypothetical protein